MKKRLDINAGENARKNAHSKCAFALILSTILMAQACDEGSSSPKAPIDDDPCSACGPEQVCKNDTCYDPNDPCIACGPNQVCKDGTCYEQDPNDPCSACGPDQICKNGKCYDSDDPCLQCTGNQVCVDKTCKNPDDGAKCDPECTDGKQCIDGRCALCIGSECFFDGDDDPVDPQEDCQIDEDCSGEDQICENGECISSVCDPECSDGQSCERGKCKSETLLWDLCNNQADCISGECIYYLTPSKELKLDVDGEIQTFTSDNPIPVNLLDERINADYYNRIHPNSDLSSDTMVGICTYECTKEKEAECPSDWTCQVVAKGILNYSTSGDLPFQLKLDDLEKTPFAAVCRPDESSQYDSAMCEAS
ncbi:MAG: hypothetical protein J6A01_12770, partial [Proteobacteria bacterium]|nr:hypothetical protein [Pseudomonadota bacterium]